MKHFSNQEVKRITKIYEKWKRTDEKQFTLQDKAYKIIFDKLDKEEISIEEKLNLIEEVEKLFRDGFISFELRSRKRDLNKLVNKEVS